MDELSKGNRIKNELNRISLLFQEIDANQRSIVSPLIQNAAFMKVTLEDLQEQINSEGVTEKYQNGANQFGIKQSATLQSYNSLIKNYAAVIKTLAQLVPPEKREKVSKFPVVKEQKETPEEYRQRMEKEQAHWAEEARKLRLLYEDEEA